MLTFLLTSSLALLLLYVANMNASESEYRVVQLNWLNVYVAVSFSVMRVNAILLSSDL